MPAENEPSLKITDYQPTEREVKRLEEAGLTLEQILQFDQPTEAEFEFWKKLNFGLVDYILNFCLKQQISDALNQASLFPASATDEDIRKIQADKIELVEYNLHLNLFPGKGFSKEQGQQALGLMRGQTWGRSNLKECIEQVKDFIDPPKPPVTALPSAK